MQSVKYALASLKYHQKFNRKYFFCGGLLLILILLLFLLKNTLTEWTSQAQQNLANSLPQTAAQTITQQLQQELKQISAYYHWFLLGVWGLFLLLSGLFLAASLKKRRGELVTLKSSGITKRKLCFQLWLEFVLPFMFLSVLLYLLLLILQGPVTYLLQTFQLWLLKRFDLQSFHLQATTGSEKNSFMIKIPLTNHALFSSTSLNVSTWLIIFARAIGQTLGMLGFSYLALIAVFYRKIRS